jgi:hypothetical protein
MLKFTLGLLDLLLRERAKLSEEKSKLLLEELEKELAKSPSHRLPADLESLVREGYFAQGYATGLVAGANEIKALKEELV